LLIAEIDLPFMDGRELAAHIRSLFPLVKILFVVPETSPIPASSPSAAFLRKSLDSHTLLKKIQSLMGKRVERLHATA
jgi:CheY-like chemotaxis protein